MNKKLIKLIGGPAAGLEFEGDELAPLDVNVSEDGQKITLTRKNGNELIYTRPGPEEPTAVFDREIEMAAPDNESVMFNYPDWRTA